MKSLGWSRICVISCSNIRNILSGVSVADMIIAGTTAFCEQKFSIQDWRSVFAESY